MNKLKKPAFIILRTRTYRSCVEYYAIPIIMINLVKLDSIDNMVNLRFLFELLLRSI